MSTMVSRTEDQPLRLAGVLLLIGAVLTLVGIVAAIPADGIGSFNRPAWIVIHVLLLLGATFVLLGLPALYLRQATDVGPVGLLGFALLFTGFLGIGFFVAAAQTVLLPWVYDKGACTLGCHLLSTTDGPPLYFWFWLVEALATFVGLILLGLATVRAGIFPATAGYLLTIAGVLAVPLAFVSVSSIIALIPQVLALVAVSWMALGLLTDPSALMRR